MPLFPRDTDKPKRIQESGQREISPMSYKERGFQLGGCGGEKSEGPYELFTIWEGPRGVKRVRPTLRPHTQSWELPGRPGAAPAAPAGDFVTPWGELSSGSGARGWTGGSRGSLCPQSPRPATDRGVTASASRPAPPHGKVLPVDKSKGKCFQQHTMFL